MSYLPLKQRFVQPGFFVLYSYHSNSALLNLARLFYTRVRLADFTCIRGCHTTLPVFVRAEYSVVPAVRPRLHPGRFIGLWVAHWCCDISRRVMWCTLVARIMCGVCRIHVL